MTTILDGKSLSDKITADLKEKISTLTKKPKLAVILVGSNPASEIYVRNKQKKAAEIGFESVLLSFPKDISEENLLEQIYILNEDSDINAILIQLPISDHLNKQRIQEAVDPIKDADGFTTYNFGRLALGYKPYVYPCTPKGIIRLLDEYDIPLEGKNALVIGRSAIVGKPVSILLQARNATVTTAHSKTKNLKELCQNAEIIVSAVGKPKFLTSDYIKDGAIIVDVGINRTENGLCGDVDFENVKEKTSFISPVPKGVGPMTIAMLMENTFELYNLQKKLLI